MFTDFDFVNIYIFTNRLTEEKFKNPDYFLKTISVSLSSNTTAKRLNPKSVR
jgi:hypothetical protein